MSFLRWTRSTLPWLASLVIATASWAGEPGSARVSFLDDVAPLLRDRCIGCHNVKKAEGKYDLTTFAGLAKGGREGEGITLEPGRPTESRLFELIRPDGEPRMPYKQDPLAAEAIDLIRRWIEQGATYDGEDPAEDWVALLHRRARIEAPEVYQSPLPVSALAFSPDGKAVVASGDHEITLWDATEGTLRRRLPVPDARIYDIAFSPDGRWLATAGGDPGRRGAARLWVAEPGGGAKPVRDLVETSDSVLAVAFSPDSRRVAAAGSDRTVRIWDVEGSKLQATIDDHADWVLAIAFSRNGRRVATASRDKTSKVFDVATRATLATFAGHAETVHAVAFAPDGGRVVSAGADNLIRIWDPDDDAKPSGSLSGFDAPVLRLAYGADGERLIAASADRTIRVFQGPALKLTLEGHADWVTALALSPDGRTIGSGSWDGEVRLWRTPDGRLIRRFVAAPGLVRPGLL